MSGPWQICAWIVHPCEFDAMTFGDRVSLAFAMAPIPDVREVWLRWPLPIS